MTLEDALQRESDAADAPVAGFYSYDRRGRVSLPVKIWWGPPIEPGRPLDSEPLDRSPRWQMMLGERLVDPSTVERESDEDWGDVWPRCGRSPITEQEYRYRMGRIAFAKSEDAGGSDPWAHRQGRLDLLHAPIP